MKNTILTTTTLAITAVAAVSANAADAAAPKPARWESSAAVGLTITDGNSESILFTGNLQSSKKWDKNEISLGLDGAYGENDGERSTAYIHGFGQYNRLFTERVYGYFRVDALNDDMADINYRVTLSPGAGYYFIKNAKTSLSGELGPGYVFENVGGREDDYLTLRVAERFEHKLSATAKVWQMAEYLPAVEDFGNYVFNFEIGLETSISKSMSLRTYVQDTYRSEPAPGRENNDIKLVAAIAYKF